MTLAACDRRLLTSLKACSNLATLGVIWIGCLVLLGWSCNLPLLKSLFLEGVIMKPNTALSFVLSGVALKLLPSSARFPKRLAQVCILAIAGLGIVTLGEFVLGWNLGIDQLLFADQLQAIAADHPGRMSIPVAFNFIWVSGALFLLGQRRIPYKLIQLLTFGIALISLQILICALYNHHGVGLGQAPFLSLALFEQIALSTALTFLLLAIGMGFAAPDQGWMKLIISNTIGGITARLLLPAAIAIPLGLGGLQIWGEQAGWFDAALGLSVQISGSIITLISLIYYCAERLYHIDRQRQQAETALQRAYTELELRVQQRTEALSQTNQALEQEIQERLRIETTLRQSEDRFRHAILDAPLPIILHAEGGEVLQVNRAWTEITGYSPEEIPTIADWTAKAYGDRQDQMQTAIARLYTLQNRLASGEHPVTTRTGETRIWDFYSAPLGQLPDGRKMVMTTTLDVTERKQAETALQQSLKDLADLKFALEQSSIIAITNAQGTITYANDKFCELSQFSQSELIGQNHRIINSGYHPKTFFQQMWATISQGQVWQGEIKNRAKDGSFYWVATTIVPFLDSHHRPYQYIAIRYDITQRKQAEENLRQSEAQARARAEELETFMETVPVAVWIARDPQCHDTIANRAAYHLLKRPAGSILTATPASGEYPFSFKIQCNGQDLAPDDLPMQIAGRTGQKVELEFEFVFENGEVRLIDGRAVPLYNPAGQVRGVIGAFWDLTDRKRAEAALRQSEERFRQAILNAPIPISIHADDGAILQVNHAWIDLSGYAPAEIPTIADWAEKAYGNRQDWVQSNIQQLHLLNQRVAEGEYVIRTRTGETRIWDFYSAPLGQLPDGRNLGISTAIDVTERKQTEEALKASEQRFRATFDQAAVGMAHVSLEGRWLLVNQKLCDIVGYSGSEILQKTFQDITYPDDLEIDLEYARQLLAGEIQTYSLEKRYIRQDGLLTWINLTGSLVHRADGTPDYFISIIQDINDRKAAENQIQQLNATLEQRIQERTAQIVEVNQELKRFTYTVSHDLRSPLRAIRGLIEALVEDYGDGLDELGREYTRLIADSARRMDQLIQDLLAYSRLSQTEIQLQPISLNTLIPEVLNQIEAEKQAKQAEITVEFPLPCVMAQPRILTQALTNLLTNSLKYVAPGVSPYVRIWAEIREADQYSHPQNWVRLWIADNGIGIEPEHHERIFKVFERLHAADAYSGTGVGLAIVQKGIERLGGRVGVVSQVGQGSQFWLELPQALIFP